MFSSKTPRDLNHDRYPWRYLPPYGSEVREQRFKTLVDGLHFAQGTHVTHSPRPEFDHVQHNPPNPILTDYRLDVKHTTWRKLDPRDWLTDVLNDPTWSISGHPWSDAEVAHARAVLTRLARLSEGANA